MPRAPDPTPAPDGDDSLSVPLLPLASGVVPVGAAARAADETMTEVPPSPRASPRGARLRAGTQVKHYELVRPLGTGGMGTVFLARDTKLGRLVALKVMREAGPEQARRLLLEARVTARCCHENIVVVYDVDALDDGRPYLVLEYLEGLTLRDWLARHERPEPGAAADPVAPALAIELVRPVLRALAHAHALGIVHRDLKPANVMLTDAGPVKVLDFGIAKRFDSGDLAAAVAAAAPAAAEAEAVADELTRPGAVLGTFQYMAPEQWRREPVDARTDVWAAGVLLFRLVVGAHPLGRASLAELARVAVPELPMPPATERCPGLAPALGAVIDRCLRKAPDERYASAGELLAALEALAPAPAARVAGEAEEGPFAGLAALQEGDAGRFFGRDREVTAALGRLRAQPLLAVAGPSGAGKSSFVRAGLLPAWRRAHPSAEALVLRPGRRPLAALAEALLALGGPHDGGAEPGESAARAEGEAGRLAERLADRPGQFGALLRARCRRRGPAHRLLAFVDQFEELYTLGAPPDERDAFVACLLGAADDPSSPLRVAVSLRSDFLDRPAEHPAFAAELGRGLLLLPPVGPPGLRDALVRPLEAAGYRFEEEGLVATMVGELAGARCPLPLLQFTAAQLWRERDRERRVLTRASYARLGGVGGALSAHADATLASLAPAERSLCRALLVRLVTAERTRAVVGLGELRSLGEEPAAVERVLARLADARLVLLSPAGAGDEGDGPTVELAHESLVERWGALARWLDESAHDAQFVARLGAAARQWHEAGEAEGLVWRDRAADEARAWAERRRGERVPGVGARERRFLAAVVALSDRARRRRRAATAAAVSALTAVALAVTLLAWRARREADRANREADRVRAEAARADRQAAAARNVSRLSVAREQMATDPTAALGLLREVEPPDVPPDWAGLARRALVRGVSSAVLAHPDFVLGAAFSPDGRRVATACWDGLVRVWNADGSGEPLVLRGHGGGVSAVAFSPDDSGRLASASFDKTVRVWPADGAGEPLVLRGHEGPVKAVAFSPDGRLLATGSGDHTVRVWDAGGAGEPLVLRGHEHRVITVAFSPDGRQILSASEDNTARLWPADGSRPPDVLRGHAHYVNSAAFGPDGARVVTGSSDQTLRLWNARAPSEPPLVFELSGGTNATAFSPDGRYVLSVENAAVSLWGVGGAGPLATLNGHANVLNTVAFSPDGRLVVSSSDDKTARVWDVREAAKGLTFRGHEGDVHDAALSRDGRRLASASFDKTVRVWPADGSARPVVLRGHEQVLMSVAFSPDGRHVVSGSEDQTARVWPSDGAGDPVVLRGHEGIVLNASFSPDGRRVATASKDRTVRVWNADGSGRPVVLRGHDTWVRDATFSPDGRLVASAGDDKTVRVWPADGAGEPLVLRGTAALNSAAFSPDGRRIVAGSEDGSVLVWNADGSGPPVVLRGRPGEEIKRAAFDAEGARIIVASKDRTARVWPADGAGEPLVLRIPDELILYADLGPDGPRVVTKSTNTLRLWTDLAPAQGDAPLWRASSYCLPPERRAALLQATEADARYDFEACARRARAALAPRDE